VTETGTTDRRELVPLTDVALVLNPADDVAVAMRDLAAGLTIAGGDDTFLVKAPIPRGHKLAIRPVTSAQPVKKYGEAVGTATQDIEPGDHVHSHNLAFANVEPPTEFRISSSASAIEPRHDVVRRTFQGYRRSNGRVGTRNYVGIVTSVNCSATVAKMIADQFRGDAMQEWPHVDGVVALTHGLGCGMASSGEGFDVLQRTINGYGEHPNFGGVLALGLGCEVNQVDTLTIRRHDDKPTMPMTIQATGGTRATVREGVARVRDLLDAANDHRREEVPASELILGLNCGGSDGYSGLTANPALGVASDLLVQQGGASVLAETPEIYGAEHLLLRRASSPEVAEQLLALLRWWEKYAAAGGGSLDNNPSPGNKAGGLTTILEKSLGAVAKGGSSPLSAVVRYAERVRAKGLVFMDTPGYDPVSVTGIVAGGANIVCFTTGRGSVFGCKPAPSLKLCTNSETYNRMTDDMDINCGRIVDGDATVDELGHEIFERILEVASGSTTKSEELGFGDEEFTPWQIGAVM
jgi:altronate hydrolase